MALTAKHHWLWPLVREDRIRFLLLIAETIAANPKVGELMKSDRCLSWQQALQTFKHELKIPSRGDI